MYDHLGLPRARVDMEGDKLEFVWLKKTQASFKLSHTIDLQKDGKTQHKRNTKTD